MRIKDAEAVTRIIRTKGLVSLEPQPANLNSLAAINKVVLLGSSASGKSTIETRIRAVSTRGALEGKVSVARRVVTRPPRPDDVDLAYCNEEEFAQSTAAGEFGMYGIKVMEGGREEPFGLTLPDEGNLPVYPANNIVVKNPERVRPTTFLHGALLVVVYAPDTIREQRMRSRSPQMFIDRPEEAAFRLSPGESSDRMRSGAHLAINNYGANESRSEQDIIKFLSELAE